MKEQVTAIFDIGKTNKKIFLFDQNLKEITHEYVRFDEIPDDDGFPSEDLASVVTWMKNVFDRLLSHPDFELKSINFSTYGASLVHLDAEGNLAVPFYNYLKPFDPALQDQFFEQYGNPEQFSLETSSPILGFLNSGFQLFYLKKVKPEQFARIRHTLHFPQYLSYIFTRQFTSEYTSIGCHTAMWDFERKKNHQWIESEGLADLLPPILPSDHSYEVTMNDRKVRVGIGVHDSSSALVPYIRASGDVPFILISTGTWSICMNYFNEEELTPDELEKDCLTFLSAKGTNIKASRLFLGKHISQQARILCEHFKCEYNDYKSVKFDPSFRSLRKNPNSFMFNHALLAPERFGFTNNPDADLNGFDSYEEAYHQLVDELTDLLIASLKLAIGRTAVKNIFLDGGFSSNEVFMQMLTNKLPEYSLYSSSFAKGTALGAAILVNQASLPRDYFTNHYRLKLHQATKITSPSV